MRSLQNWSPCGCKFRARSGNGYRAWASSDSLSSIQGLLGQHSFLVLFRIKAFMDSVVTVKSFNSNLQHGELRRLPSRRSTNNFFHMASKPYANSGASTIEMIASDLLSHDTIREADEDYCAKPRWAEPHDRLLLDSWLLCSYKIEDVPETYKDLLEVFRRRRAGVHCSKTGRRSQ